MGRIKTSFTKNVGRTLLEKHPDKFSSNFEENKLFLKEVAIFESKRLRNIVAGYITGMKTKEKNR